MSTETNEPVEYTIPQLDAAVEANTITVQQKDQILQAQQQRRNEKMIREGIANGLLEAQVTQAVGSDLGDYQSLVPDLMKDGTPTRERVRREYEYLVSRGAPQNHATELAAARAALGPIERIRQRRAASPEPFADGGAGRASFNYDTSDPNGPPRGLTRDQHTHYSRLIDRGIYSSWDQVKGELGWKRGAAQQTQQRNRGNDGRFQGGGRA